MTPRPYLSYTQLMLWERSPKKYIEVYLEGQSVFVNKGMKMGKDVAEALETDDPTGDPVTDFVLANVPKFDSSEFPIEVALNGVPLYGKIDTFNNRTKKAFKEYKTGLTPWTQKTVDENDQITFYTTLVYGKYGLKPECLDMELVYMPTRYNEHKQIELTGEIIRFRTKRTFIDLMKMSARQRKAWAEIQAMCMEYSSDIPMLT